MNKTKTVVERNRSAKKTPQLERQPQVRAQQAPSPLARKSGLHRLVDSPAPAEEADGLPGTDITGRARLLGSLQGSLGNFQVSRLYGGNVQAKLKVGAPHDPYEQEADRVADAVMRMPSVGFSREYVASSPTTAPHIRRSCPKSGEEAPRSTEESGAQQLQAERTSDRPVEAPPALETYVSSSGGAGQPLPPLVRASMEGRFGQDFGGVRVHSGEDAAVAADSVSAQAFTAGQDIYFGRGKYRPETSEGQRLLAHELTHSVQQSGTSLRSRDQNRPIGREAQSGSVSISLLESRSDVLRARGAFRQTMRLRRRYTYTGESGAFQPYDFSPDLRIDIRNWLTGRMQVFVHEERPFDVLSGRLLSAFRQAHRVLGDRVALRRGQSYTYSASIDISGSSIRITDVRINDLSPTADLVLRRLESLRPMQWEAAELAGSGCTTDFCTWVTEATETRAPALAASTTLNCWEAILLAAYHAGVVSWQWLHNLYERRDRRGDTAFANMLSRGRRILYAPPRQVPVRGDIVFFWTGNHLSHVGLATGRLNPRGASPEVIAFQGSPTGPPVRATVEPPSVRLSAGGRMRIEYARPPW